MKRVLLIVNPKSGRTKPKSMLYEIIDIMSQYDCIVTVCITRQEGDAVRFACDACNSDLYDLIVSCGGDGTLSDTIAGILKSSSPLPIGYIPCGSTNDYAKSLGISSDYTQSALKAVTGKPFAVDIGKINGKNFNYIASFGIFTSASYSAPRSLKSMLGHLAYVLEGTKELAKIKSYHIRIESDSGIYEDDYIFGAVANSTSIGGIVKLDEELVSFNDGVFETCLVKMPRNPADLVKIVRGTMNSDFSTDCFEFFRASSLNISAPCDMAWSLDGEKFEPGSDINIEVMHSAVNLIV